MIIFKGSYPKDSKELSQLLRGINTSFCFYDDLSKKEKRKLRIK